MDPDKEEGLPSVNAPRFLRIDSPCGQVGHHIELWSPDLLSRDDPFGHISIWVVHDLRKVSVS
jgi:hypothetical protein